MCLGGTVGRQDGPGDRLEAQGASEPGEQLEAPGDRRPGRGVFERGGPRAAGSRDRGSRSSRQDRPVDGRTGFFGRRAQAMSREEGKAMIAPDHPELSVSHQCKLLSISRSSFYYAPMGDSPENLALMRRIDELFLKYPFYGSRQMVRQLRRGGGWGWAGP